MKAIEVDGLGIYRLKRAPGGSYELECRTCSRKVDLDQMDDPHARWTDGLRVSLAEICPIRKGDELEQQLSDSNAAKDFGTGG